MPIAALAVERGALGANRQTPRHHPPKPCSICLLKAPPWVDIGGSMMFKAMLIAGVIVVAGSAAPALAQSRAEAAYAAARSYSSLRASCDRALAARGRADASTAVRERCVAILRARLAGKRSANCYRYSDPRYRGWSLTAQGFNRMEARGLRPCPDS
jgi:hypothetical protein